VLGRKKANSTYQWQIMILSSMPGIGPGLARRLIEHFKTLKSLANADVKELTQVEKIGKKKAQGIHDILNAQFNVESE
jgi:Fanconi anemia group M protein